MTSKRFHGDGLDGFPTRLRALRKNLKPVRSMHVTSELMGLPPGALRRYELGELEPRLKALMLIADFYHVSTDYLLGRTSRRY